MQLYFPISRLDKNKVMDIFVDAIMMMIVFIWQDLYE